MPTTKTPAAKPVRKPVAKKEVAPPAPATPSQLATLIPDPSVAKSYVSRYIDGVLDLDVLANAQKRNLNVLIEGDTGAGKTLFVRAYAATTAQPFVNMSGEGSATPDDFFGGAAVDVNSGSLRWLDGPVLMVIQEGGVLNIDEVNFFKGKTTAALHGIFDGRGVLTLNKHPYHWLSSSTGRYYISENDAALSGDTADVRVSGTAYIKRADNMLAVATYNPDYTDTAPLNEAFRNRFARKLVWDYDNDVESTLIFSKRLLEMAQKLRASRKAGVIQTPISTNMLMEFEAAACDDDLQFSFAASCFINNFTADERNAVMEVFKLYKDGLMSDYGWSTVV